MEDVIEESQRSQRLITTREQELQKLLAEERHRSEQRKTNYSTLKSEHVKLQKDFLGLQSEMKQVLEETKFIKDKKDNELEHLLKQLDERDKIIERFRNELKERDPQVIKDHFAQELHEPIKRLEKERDFLIREKDKLGYELKIAKQKIGYLEKENLDGIERVKLAYEAEINLIRKEKEELRLKLIEVSQTPDAQKLLNLSQENSKLHNKVKNFQATIDEAEQQYRKIQKKIEMLMIEQEKNEKEYENQNELNNLRITNLKEDNRKFREIISNSNHEKDEMIVELKRLQNENHRLKKEYEQLEIDIGLEKDKLRQSILKEQNDLEKEKDALLEEIKKFKIESMNKEDALQRLEKENVNKLKETQLNIGTIKQQEFEKRCAIEQEKANLEMRLKEAKEERHKLKDEINQLKRQIENNYELRMGLEKDLLILRAKVESHQSNIEELDKLRRQHLSLHDELNKLRSENAEYLAMNRELVRQRERYKDDFERIKLEVFEERKQMSEFKIQSEKHLNKLKNCIEEERFEMMEKLSFAEKDAFKWKKERDEAKFKYKQYSSLTEKLQNKLILLDDQISNKTSVPVEVHKQMKKQLKSLKKKQSELSSLLNCTFDSTQCKQIDEQQLK